MSALVLLVVVAFFVGVIYFIDPVRVWRRYRGERIVTCPETKAPAAVSVDVGHAAFTSLVEGRPDLRLANCSRWPERGHCDEPCIPDVEAAGVDGTVAAIVTNWCRSKQCVLCGKPIAAPDSKQHPAALRGPDGVSVLWRSVPPERLPSMFPTHQPVCWDCHHIETFRREHKELVVER
jgi:hypothetical protein